MSLKNPKQTFGVDVEWKAWKMPEGAQPPAKPEGYMEQAKVYLANLVSRSRLDFHPPSRKMKTELAHIGGKFAQEKGSFDLYHQRIFQAVWQKDEDIENPDILIGIAEEAEIDPIEFRSALGNAKYRSMVEADYQLAKDKQIWTIPSYIGPKGIIQVHHFEDIPSLDELGRILD